jgi:phosphoglycerate dehydrogenase-like enzyme
MNIEVVGAPPAAIQAEIDERAFSREVAAGDGDCLFLWSTDVAATRERLEANERIQWVHMRNAGVPPELIALCDGHSVLLTNGSGAHAPPIGEYVVAALLALTKRIPTLLANQARREWDQDLGIRELDGKTIGIIGLGALGRATARLLRPFGVRLLGVNRSGSEVAEVDEVYRTANLDAVLPRVDALVIAAPLTAETDGLIGAAALAMLPTHALVVNVGRGEIVDEEALDAALRGGNLGGAALDVFVEEPLPRESPLWSAPNVLISPHAIDETPQTQRRNLELFYDNLRRWVGDQPLINVVDSRLGY